MPIRLLEPRTIAGYRHGEGAILDLQDNKEEEWLVDRAYAEWYSIDGDAALAKANNLADLPDKPIARSNLGLGALAVNGEAAADSNRFLGFGGGASGQVGSTAFTRGLNVNCLTGNTGSPSVGEVIYNYVNIRNDSVDGQAGGGTKVNGLLSDHYFGGSSAKGGRHALVGRLIQTAATSSDSTDRFYVGVVGNIQSSTGDGGTPGDERGSYFGFNGYARLRSGATDAYIVSAGEFNSILDSGASALNRTGIQVVGGGDGRGSSYDAAISISNLTGSTNSWWKGIDFTNRNGVNALGADSIAFSVSQPGQILTGLLFTCPISGSILRYANASIDLKFGPTALTLNSNNYSIELGSAVIPNSPHLDFHSSGNDIDYDSRIIATGGTALAGSGNLTYTAATHSFVGDMKFGTFTSGAVTASGYVEITDATGRVTKLLAA